MAQSSTPNKMMLGFIVRRFVTAKGHEPSPEEFAEWANHYREDDLEICLFGKNISAREAEVILRHRGRPVSTRNARSHDTAATDAVQLPSNVTSMAEARERRTRRHSRG